jgi:hypothetical protein
MPNGIGRSARFCADSVMRNACNARIGFVLEMQVHRILRQRANLPRTSPRVAMQRVCKPRVVTAEIDYGAVESEARIANPVAIRKERKTRHAQRVPLGECGVRSGPHPVQGTVRRALVESSQRAANRRRDHKPQRAGRQRDKLRRDGRIVEPCQFGCSRQLGIGGNVGHVERENVASREDG